MPCNKVSVLNIKKLFEGYVAIEEALLKIKRCNTEKEDLVRRIAIVRDDAVGAVLYCPATQEIILVSQFRYPVFRHGCAELVEIPAGMVDNNEKPYTTIKREILEETGYEVSRLKFVQSYYISPGISSERLHLFYGVIEPEDQKQSGGGLDQEHEHIEVLKWPVEKVYNDLIKGRIKDGKTIIALQWFFLNYFLENKSYFKKEA